MKNLFVRLYLVLIIAFIGLGISIDTYIEQTASGRNDSEQLTSDIALHKGTFFLLNKELKRLPLAERNQYLTIISSSFGFTVELNELTSLTFSKIQLEHLNQAGIVSVYDDEKGKVWFFQKLDNSDQVMSLGPIFIEANNSTDFLINLLFFAGLALIIFLWAWPLSKGLGQLTKAAIAFGKGDFSVRAQTKTSAPLIELVNRFNSMATRIQRLIKSHQELSHAVSHELRTPIARIRFAMEMVKELDDKTQQLKYMQVMDDNIEELDGLVDELLTYARFDRDEPDLRIESQDIIAVAYHAISKFQLTHSQLSIVCSNEASKKLLCCFDNDAIERTLDNLIRNACRYAKNKIQLTLKIEDEKIVVWVDDDGLGVPIEARDQLFEPFVRLDQSRDRNSGGIGLGLAMVKRLMELHQGCASVDTAELGGARFILSWPVH